MMSNAIRVMVFIGFIPLTMLLSGCAEYGNLGTSNAGSMESAATSESLETAPLTGPDRIAPGAQQDTLEACLARIPSDATPGQRLIAERTCQRDQENRQPILAVPGK